MGIRDRKFFAVPMLAVLFVVAGCSSSEPQVIDESKYEDLYDDDADSGDDSEGLDDEDFPEPPELPDAVKDESEDGAVAAVEYFLDAYEFAYRTSDSSHMAEIGSSDCEVCEELLQPFEERRDLGDRTNGVDFSLLEIKPPYENEYGMIIDVDVSVTEHDVVDKSGNVEDHVEENYMAMSFLLNRYNGTWLITDFYSEDPR